MSELQRKLTLYGLTMIAVGSSIGSGIFLTPSDIAGQTPHHGFILLAWLIGGLIALTGALTFAELGGMFPNAGGVYVYLREAYGERVGFLYGWITLLVINTGALAALGIGLTKYLTFFFHLSESGKILTGVVVVGGLTAVNLVGVHISQGISSLFTGLKLLAIAGIVLVGLFWGKVPAHEFTLSPWQDTPSNPVGALLLALIGVLWSVGGWHHASYVAGEAVNAQRTVPRAMVLGALIVTVTYLLANIAYMRLLTLSGMAASDRVAGDAVATVLPFGGQIVASAIAISIFGTIAIYTMSAPRIYYAMAKDGIFFNALAKVHPRFHTPVNAMITQAVWAMLLLLFWGTFENLIAYVTFMDIAFMGLGGAAVFVLRRKQADRSRPYRVWAYPWIPAFFVLISVAFVINTLIAQPWQALAGLLVLGTGLLIFEGFRKRK